MNFKQGLGVASKLWALISALQLIADIVFDALQCVTYYSIVPNTRGALNKRGGLQILKI